MKFRENEKSEQWIQFLQQYIFDKNYDHDIVDLVLKALSNIYMYMHQIFVFENSIDNPPYGDIGEKFTKCINLIKPGYHYNLVVSSEKHKTSGAR